MVLNRRPLTNQTTVLTKKVCEQLKFKRHCKVLSDYQILRSFKDLQPKQP